MKTFHQEDLLKLKEEPAFVQAMSKAATPEEIRKVFAAYDIELTAEEAEAAFALASGEEELGLEDLEAVSGGNPVDSALRKVVINGVVFLVSWCWHRGKLIFSKK